MATLINGNGNPRIYAAQDADLIAALAGDITGIAQIGNKFAATAVDANTISVADGVIVTKEGRRIQLDAGSTDMFVIPTGTTGVTNYYIIGYKLTTQSDDSQIAETFVQLMSSSSETITEDTFREGATDVYVSLYRVQQNGVNLGTITGLLPELTNISELKSDLAVATKTYTLSSIVGTNAVDVKQVGSTLFLQGFVGISGAVAGQVNVILTINNYDGIFRRGVAIPAGPSGVAVDAVRTCQITTNGELQVDIEATDTASFFFFNVAY